MHKPSRAVYFRTRNPGTMRMISFLTVIAACGLSAAASARHVRNWGMYGGLQITQASMTGVKGSLDVHWHQKNSIGISLAWIETRGRNVPSDYDQYRPQSWFGSNDPLPDLFYIWTLSYGRYSRLTHDGKLRVHARVGLSAGLFEGAENYRLVYHPSTGWLSSTYTTYVHDDASRNFYGVTLNPALEYSPGRGFGFTAGALACINSERFCIAGEAGVIFGVIRNRAKRSAAASQQ